MWCQKGILLACIFHTSLAVWSCSENIDCSSLEGSVCSSGNCVCPQGQQPAFRGTRCVDLAPYHTSPCVEDHQCSRLFSTFECRHNDDEEGICACQAGYHYFLGRCWPTSDYGEPCGRDEHCLGTIRDPFSLSCNGTCQCAEGYYERQRGECRRIGEAVGDGCVLDTDCHFEGGACDVTQFTCYNANVATRSITTKSITTTRRNNITRNFTTRNGIYDACPCSDSLECFLGSCVCPVGYYSSEDGMSCLAELGSPATDAASCTGILAVIINGICTCPPNFFFDENMRDCIRVSRRINESCVHDSNCHTFGTSARCGPPQQWGMRSCECNTEEAVWDEQRQMCRLFARVGDTCEVDSDCLAGELEIQCVVTEGRGVCTCPEGYNEVDGLCLTTGLELGDECQATPECTEAPNTVCENGRCSCDSNGYQEVDGVCAPVIGGVCTENADCVIENTVCVNSTVNADVFFIKRDTEDVFTCRCDENFVEDDEECWPVVQGYDSQCNVTAQCTDALGPDATCGEGRCQCTEGHHHRDGSCWPMIGLFESCSRSSQCYLSDITDRTVCRNSLCQCDFDFPYSEQLHTCITDGATSVNACIFTTITALLYLSLG